MKLARLNRLFGPDGKCFDVAIDHGFFNEAPFLSGIESMPQAVRTVVDAAPDAIQLTVGQARHLQDQESVYPGDHGQNGAEGRSDQGHQSGFLETKGGIVSIQ